MDDLVKEFLIESYEYLNSLDNDLIELEKASSDPELLARIFRAVHTIKGTSGFLGYEKLVAITHVGEGLLDRLRKGALVPDAEITDALLALVDAIRQILNNIETTQAEGDESYDALAETLTQLQSGDRTAAPVPADTDAKKKDAVAEPVAEAASTDQGEASETRSAPEQTLDALQVLYARTGQAVSLAELAEERGLAEGTIRNHLTVLKKEGTVSMAGDNTYEPAGSIAGAAPAPTPASSAPEPTTPEPTAQAPAAPAFPRATPSSPASEDGAAASKSTLADNTIRVDVELLDRLMNLVGELVLTRNQIIQSTSINADTALISSTQHLNLITTELQEGVMKTRMQPIGNVWSKFPRVVRDIATPCGKEARVEMEGADTELDKTIIEAIKDPLTHLVRNAVDHGIESPEEREALGKPREGCLLLRAYHEGGQVNIEIIDDGAGIKPERIKQKALDRGIITQADAARLSDREVLHLVFMPGFSTADAVSNISGRGVGMDVVKTNIEKIGGIVDVNSKTGSGTTFKIKIPLTLAIIPALIVTTGGDRYAIPQVNLLELVRLEGEQVCKEVEMIHNTPVYRLRGKLLPLVYLTQELQLSRHGAHDGSEGGEREVINIVVLQADDQNFGLVVDEIIDTEEVVVKPLSKQLKHISAFAGATIMGDGKIALILDVLGLAQRAGVLSEEARARTKADARSQHGNGELQALLLLKACENRRLAVPLSVVSRLEEIPQANVEWAGEQELVQYRGHLMPLIRLSRTLGMRYAEPDDPEALMQVVVCGHNGSSVGLVVDEIVDVVEEEIDLHSRKRRDSVLGVAVILGKVTELLDVERIIDEADLSLFSPAQEGVLDY